MTALSRLVGRLCRLRPPEYDDVLVERDLAVTADDGEVLLADRWAPAGVDPAGVPIVLLRSPYGRRTLDLVARLLAERGYQVVIQSVRGTFGSGGRWSPFRHERADGHATLRWLERQPWWSGAVGTFGPSYLGLTQWAVTDDPPAALRAMALSITSSAFRDAVVYTGGTFTLETGATWLNLLEHQEEGWRGALASQVRARRALRAAYTTLPLADAEAAGLGRTIDYYQEWLAHERPGDPWWDQVDFGRDVSRTPPAALLAGWYDIFLPYQLDDYARLLEAGRTARLTVGPWTHSSLRVTGAAIADGLDWFDDRFQRGAGRSAPVRLRLLGTRQWVELDRWPPPGQQVRWYLHGGGALRRSEPGPSDPSRYRWDPADPTPGHGGASLNPATAGARNQRRREERHDVVTFTTDPLPAGFTLAGPVEAEIWLRSSNWHTDLFVRLCDVRPSGRSVNLSDGILRLEPAGDATGVTTPASPSDGEVSAAATDGSVQVRIRMWPTGVRLGGGHRLRLQVSGGAHPLFARNLGGGERLGTATQLVPADHEILHDPDHRSFVTLPHARV